MILNLLYVLDALKLKTVESPPESGQYIKLIVRDDIEIADSRLQKHMESYSLQTDVQKQVFFSFLCFNV